MARWNVILSGFALLSALTACGGEEGPFVPDEGGPSEQTPPSGGSSVVTPEEGGTVRTTDGRVTVEIPPGAVPEDTVITITPSTGYPDDPQVVPGTVYDFEPDGIVFAKPITMTIDYDPAKLRPGIAEPNLRLHKVAGAAWLELPNGKVDLAGKAASAPVSGFSSYGVRSTEPPASQEDGGAEVVDDGGVDAGADSGLDAGADAGLDAGADAGLDAGTDAGITTYRAVDDFWLPGVGTYRANAAVVAEDGKLYVATDDGVAMHSGNARSVLPGSGGQVEALATIGDALYVAGNFTTYAGVSANSIIRWDGVSWSGLGSGLRLSQGGATSAGTVHDLQVYNGKLYVGGHFNRAGAATVSSLAVWDPTTETWADIGGGAQAYPSTTDIGRIRKMAVDSSGLYVLGQFEKVGGSLPLSLNNIARWTGAAWEDLEDDPGYGLSWMNQYGGMTIVDGDLYVVSGSTVWQRKGGAWKLFDMDDALPGAAFGTIAYAGGSFYIGGYSPSAATNFLTWNGDMDAPSLSTVGVLLDYSAYSSFRVARVEKLIGHGSDLLAIGQLRLASTTGYTDTLVHSSNIVRLENLSTWRAVCDDKSNGIGAAFNDSFDGVSTTLRPIEALAVQNDSIYAAGAFTTAGCESISHLSRWDGVRWNALGDGIDGPGRALQVIGDDVYVGGHFTHAGGAPANHVARWNGASWSALGTGANDVVTALTASGSTLYLGGDFTNVAGTLASRIASWNGAAASPLGAGLNGTVHALVASGTDVYAGGGFTGSGPTPLEHVARWDGAAWNAMGAGLDGEVTGLAVIGTKVFAVGNFTPPGGPSKGGVAVWNGATWTAPIASDLPLCSWMVGRRDGCAIRADAGAAQIAAVGGVWRWDGSSAPVKIASITPENGLSDGGSLFSVAAMVRLGNDLYLGGQMFDAAARPAMRDWARSFVRLAP